MSSRSVDVFVADLATVEIDEDVLSVIELWHAMGVASSSAFRDYLATRTWLRKRLSQYLGIAPAAIELPQAETGRQRVVVPDSDLAFSLSYTGGVAVLAIGPDALVGVDVETTDGANIDPKSVHTVLTPPEVTAVVAAGDRVSAFLRFWVRKQALGKAIGIGPEELARRDMSGRSPVRQDGFDVTDVALGEGLVAAVAVPTGTRLELMTTAQAAA